MAFFRKTLALTFLWASLFVFAPGRAESSAGDLPRQAWLGGSLRSPAGGKAGAEVARVQPGTAAEKDGWRVGDRVLRINGQLLSDPVVFERVYGGLRGGDTAEFEILRDGQVMTRKLSLPPLPMEKLDTLDVTYGSVLTDRGYRVRTIFTKPKGAHGKLPGILVVGWLSCNSPEWPLGGKSGTMKLLHGVATASGYAMLRVDKPGAGDSEGPPCVEADFLSELAGYRAGLQALKRHPDVDPDRILILGLSNGGGVAPLVAEGERVRGYVVSGAWVKTWFEHMMEHERRRLALIGTPIGEINQKLAGYAELYTLYYIQKLTPGEAIRQKPHLAALWYDEPAHQYGRPAAFYHQLQDLNLPASWDKVEVPVLVVAGENDWIMTRDDQEMIAAIVNRRHPGLARFVLIPKMDHSFLEYESMEAAFKEEVPGTPPATLVPLVVDWMKHQASAQ
jgi:pimeloyl-ACP methyl ester carboxylesterase